MASLGWYQVLQKDPKGQGRYYMYLGGIIVVSVGQAGMKGASTHRLFVTLIRHGEQYLVFALRVRHLVRRPECNEPENCVGTFLCRNFPLCVPP